MKRTNNNINVQMIINEIKEFLNTGTEMSYVNSLKFTKNYKEKEIQKLTTKIKTNNLKNKVKNKIKKLF